MPGEDWVSQCSKTRTMVVHNLYLYSGCLIMVLYGQTSTTSNTRSQVSLYVWLDQEHWVSLCIIAGTLTLLEDPMVYGWTTSSTSSHNKWIKYVWSLENLVFRLWSIAVEPKTGSCGVLLEYWVSKSVYLLQSLDLTENS